MSLGAVEVIGVLSGAVVGVGGLAGLLSVFIKGRPEAGKIVVDAATGLVMVQESAIKRLNERLDALEASARERDAREGELRKELKELKADLADAIHERDEAVLSMGRLRKRIARLEEALRRLDAPIPPDPS